MFDETQQFIYPHASHSMDIRNELVITPLLLQIILCRLNKCRGIESQLPHSQHTGRQLETLPLANGTKPERSNVTNHPGRYQLRVSKIRRSLKADLPSVWFYYLFCH